MNFSKGGIRNRTCTLFVYNYCRNHYMSCSRDKSFGLSATVGTRSYTDLELKVADSSCWDEQEKLLALPGVKDRIKLLTEF